MKTSASASRWNGRGSDEVGAGELSRAAGTPAGVSRGGLGLWAAGASLLAAGPALGQISGAQVASGTASVQRQGNFTTITASNNAIINYRQFDVRPNETVRFIQPDALSRVLNRINSQVPSRIDGQIQANGRVYIVNPAGVYFGQGSMINVGGIYAAAGNITDSDFQRGINRFTTSPTGSVVNEGTIRADVVGLIAKQVANFGAIDAPQGTVAMVSGDTVLLGEKDGHVFAKVEADASRVAGPMPAGGAGSSSGGTSGRTGRFGAGDIYGLAVWNKGTVKAKDIRLESAGGGSTVVEGRLDASDRNAGATGGTVKVLGDAVSVQGAVIDASGDAGGGQVLVGGNFQGGGPERNAQHTRVGNGTEIHADAITSGDGGRVIVWADGSTRASGEVTARGGRGGGNGGFAEISGKSTLKSSAHVDLTAPKGATGSVLYDPLDIVVQGGTGDGSDATDASGTLLKNGAGADGQVLFGDTGDADPFIVTESEIEGTNANIVLQAGRSIKTAGDFADDKLQLQANRTLTLETRNLNVDGAGSIDLTQSVEGKNLLIAVTGTGSVAINGSTGAEQTCDVALSKISSGGGDVTVTTSKGSIDLGGDVSLGAGTLRLSAAGSVVQSGGSVSATGLGIRAAGNVDFPSTNAVTTLAALNTGDNAYIRYIDQDGVTVGSVGTSGAFTLVNGVRTTGGGSDIFIAGGVGAVGLTQPVNAGAGTVRLTGATVTQTSTGVITAGTLAVQTFTTDIVLDQGNDVDSAALIAPNGRSISFRDADGFTVTNTTELDFGSERIDNLSGVQFWVGSTDVWNGSGDVLLNAGAGPLTINQPIDAKGTQTTGGTVRLFASGAGGTITQSASGLITGEALGVRAGANVTLTQSNDVNTFAAANTSASATTAFTDANSVAVGIVGGAPGFTAVSGVNTANGNANLSAGSVLDINSLVDLGTGTLLIDSGGTVGQTAPIRAASMDVQALGLISLTNAANDVTNFSAATPIGQILYTDATGVTLTPVNSGTTAISTDNENAMIVAGGAIGIGADLTVGTGVLRLKAGGGGGVTQTTGAITASSLAVDAPGAIKLDQPLNDVNTFAARTSGSTADITFTDSDELTIGSVPVDGAFPALAGVSGGGAVIVQAGNNLRVSNNVSGGTSVELRGAFTSGAGNLAFTSAGIVLQSPSITLISGNGSGAATGSTVDFANLPVLRGATSGASPTSFRVRDYGSIGDAQIPAASAFAGGVTGMNYTLESTEGSVTINSAKAADVNNTNLTLSGPTGVFINAPLTLRGLSVTGPFTTGSLDVGTGTLSFTGNLTLNDANTAFTADEVDFGAGSTITGVAGQTLTLKPGTIGKDITVGGTADTAAFDLTQAELGVLRAANLSALTIGRTDGTGKLTIAASSAFNTALTMNMNAGTGDLGGDVTNEGKAITLNSNFGLSADAAVRTTVDGNPGGANVTLNGTVNNTGTTARALTIDAGTGGTATLTKAIGATAAIKSISVTGQSVALQNSVKTVNAQTYTGPVAITGTSGVALQTGGTATDSVSFSGTVNGDADLSVNAGLGQVSFGGPIGGNTALKSLTVTGKTLLPTVTTTGNQSYTGDTTLTVADFVGTSQTGSIKFLGKVDGGSSGGPFTLMLNAQTAGQAVTFGDKVGSLAAFKSVTVNGNTLFSPVTASTPVTVTTTGGAGDDIKFNGTANGFADVTLNAGAAGAVLLGGAVGTTNQLSSLTVNAVGVTIHDVSTLGVQTYNAPVTLAGPRVPLRSSTGPGGGVAFNQAVSGASSLTVFSGKTQVNAPITTDGAQTYNGTTELASNLSTTVGNIDFNGTLNLAAPAGSTLTLRTASTTGARDIIFRGAVNGADKLDVMAGGDASGTVSILDFVGGQTPLRELTVQGRTINLGSPRLATKDGGITLLGDINLTTATVAMFTTGGSAADIKLNGPVNGASNLKLNAGSGVAELNGHLGNVTPLTSLVSNAAATRFSGPGGSGVFKAGRFEITGDARLGMASNGATLTATNAGSTRQNNFKFNGKVLLENDAVIDAGPGTAFFATSVDTAPGVDPKSLTIRGVLDPRLGGSGDDISSVSPVRFAGDIGVNNPLKTLTFATAYGDMDVPQQATIVFAGATAGESAAAFDSTGTRLTIGKSFDPLGAGNVRTVRTTDGFRMAKGQKITSFGSLSIDADADNNGAGTASLGDITALGNLSVKAAAVDIVARAQGLALTNRFTRDQNGNLVSVGPRQDRPDTGTDFVAKDSIVFMVPSRSAVTGTARFATTGKGGASINGADPDLTDPTLIPVTLSGAYDRSRFIPGDEAGFVSETVLAQSTANALALDFAFNSEAPSPIAQALASALPNDEGSAAPASSVSLPSSLRQQLLDIGVYLKDEDFADEEGGRLSSRTVYNDVPRMKTAVGSLGDYAVSSRRLSRSSVMRVLESYNALAGEDASQRRARYREIQESLNLAWGRYIDQLPKSGKPDPYAFRRYLEITPAEQEPLNTLNLVRTILRQLDELGLSTVETRPPKDLLLTQIKPADMSSEQIEQAAIGMFVPVK